MNTENNIKEKIVSIFSESEELKYIVDFIKQTETQNLNENKDDFELCFKTQSSSQILENILSIYFKRQIKLIHPCSDYCNKDYCDCPYFLKFASINKRIKLIIDEAYKEKKKKIEQEKNNWEEETQKLIKYLENLQINKNKEYFEIKYDSNCYLDKVISQSLQQYFGRSVQIEYKCYDDDCHVICNCKPIIKIGSLV